MTSALGFYCFRVLRKEYDCKVVSVILAKTIENVEGSDFDLGWSRHSCVRAMVLPPDPPPVVKPSAYIRGWD